ncbi:Fe-S oxidoreductase [Pseudonocardia sp. Ae168_Ps1]|uniref:heterodisulfide reductase-related iron-sulfur binding cluster n=1 Tax=unclassified Pseudonocardia TaxID=2619320 RepID=UPI00094B520C|nr:MULTISPECIES: heterodisulfide reductase-related iron-sulfur binding cluster [unclassified Pseudonocardia]OLL74900.1 Fe-S oxidoreductase [Pseudonocardia sp. Ae150A_Ps1]OLL80892.1 Fe-S oxidoreductase [Pseudonocardia sp. Ae168_Ps1]OLL84990.1 Fe-S oxidoreductase [Pseudonocardia sp. Ae263_Ps1]OLL94993.1 Fe-S oxidoreductase [Pseudonocardia sp. Ae356_Ps1]
MTWVQYTLGIVTVLSAIAAVALVWRTVAYMVSVIRLGEQDATRIGPFGPRFATMLKETLGHTRMLKWSHVGVFHWLVMVGFGGLFLALIEAFVEVWNPTFHLPLLGEWSVYSLFVEILGVGTVVGIGVLIVIRQLSNPRTKGRMSRFYGSNQGRAYFVEAIVFLEGLGILVVRGAKDALGVFDVPTWSAPVSKALGTILPASPTLVTVFAAVKVLSATIWLIVIAAKPTMGVAWHRFTAFPNIYFKRDDDGRKALGATRPMMSKGQVLELEEADPDEDTFGVGRVEDFTWKGLLDFTTCTECGRCQSQCPAWNTEKPLSPKLLVNALRDHAYDKAPYLLAGGSTDMAGDEVGITGDDAEARLAAIPEAARKEAERPLIGGEDVLGVIDPDILWSCTMCGACVEQCPVDIEHVDHIVDMRRYQVLIESEFPTELNSLFKNLENKGNPWGQNAKDRLEWTKSLDFEVPVVESELPAETEYLFWVGCAGAFDDGQKKTVQATAELLHRAGVDFAVLGSGETCTGDPARRSGNEFVFQMLAQQNVETLNGVFEKREAGTRKIVTTCPHCLNTLGREYPQLDGRYEVVHHTQLLNKLVREKKLVPVNAPAGEETGPVTYHDPCYLGRHNEVYEDPRDLVGAAGATLSEMPRHADRSMCCGAGGARMWMEERIGKRINFTRAKEAAETLTKAGGGDEPSGTLAVGCPFCRTMMTDGVNQTAGDSVQVKDVSQMLLAAVRRGDPAPEPTPEPVVAAEAGDTADTDAQAGSEPAAEPGATPEQESEPTAEPVAADTTGEAAPTTETPAVATPEPEVAEEAARQDPAPAGSDGASSTGTAAPSSSGNGSSNGSTPEQATQERSNEN